MLLSHTGGVSCIVVQKGGVLQLMMDCLCRPNGIDKREPFNNSVVL